MPRTAKTRIEEITNDLVKAEVITSTEAIAIRRCLEYSDQIADVSIGNFFREDIKRLLAEAN
jgi:hypothetical protein